MAADDITQLQLDYLSRRLDELEKRTVERFEERTNAVNLANEVINKRFEGVNEFRAALSDQTRDFVRQPEFNAAHASLVEKVDALANQVVTVDTTVRSRLAMITSGPTFLISSASVAVVVILGLITGAIQLGSVQTHVQVNTERLERVASELSDLHKIDSAMLANDAEIRARQQFNERRLERMETKIDGPGR